MCGQARRSHSSPLRPQRNRSWAGPWVIGRQKQIPWLIMPTLSPLFFLPRHPLKCRWRLGAAQANTRSTRSPCGPWGSGTAWRWGSPTTAGVAAAPGRSQTAPDAAGTGPTSAVCVSATPATWAASASARKGRTRAGTRTCAARRRASRCAAGAGSAAAVSAPASRASLGRSTGLSASATTSPVPGTEASSAQVGTPNKHLCSEPGPAPGAVRTSPKAWLYLTTPSSWEATGQALPATRPGGWGPVCQIQKQEKSPPHDVGSQRWRHLSWLTQDLPAQHSWQVDVPPLLDCLLGQGAHCGWWRLFPCWLSHSSLIAALTSFQ